MHQKSKLFRYSCTWKHIHFDLKSLISPHETYINHLYQLVVAFMACPKKAWSQRWWSIRHVDASSPFFLVLFTYFDCQHLYKPPPKDLVFWMQGILWRTLPRRSITEMLSQNLAPTSLVWDFLNTHWCRLSARIQRSYFRWKNGDGGNFVIFSNLIYFTTPELIARQEFPKTLSKKE